MNKLLCKLVLSGFCGAVILSGQLLANEEVQDQQSNQNIPVGIRALKPAEQVVLQEKRAAKDAECQDEAEAVQQEGQPVTAANNEDGRLQSKSLMNKAYTYYTTHAGALHWPISVSPYGDTVQLEDGSIWTVNVWDRSQTLNWLATDTIIIVPGSYFSVYGYKLINVNTGAQVEVNLTLGPVYNGVFTHWIAAIDYFWNEIILEDGTVWKFFWDDSVMKNWLINDTVIIGINDGAFSSSEPNILINVSMLNYARCKCK